MPTTNPTYDPTTPEGQAISSLFRNVKGIEHGDGTCPSVETVSVLTDWFIERGIDPSGSVDQVVIARQSDCPQAQREPMPADYTAEESAIYEGRTPPWEHLDPGIVHLVRGALHKTLVNTLREHSPALRQG